MLLLRHPRHVRAARAGPTHAAAACRCLFSHGTGRALQAFSGRRRAWQDARGNSNAQACVSQQALASLGVCQLGRQHSVTTEHNSTTCVRAVQQKRRAATGAACRCRVACATLRDNRLTAQPALYAQHIAPAARRRALYSHLRRLREHAAPREQPTCRRFSSLAPGAQRASRAARRSPRAPSRTSSCPR